MLFYQTLAHMLIKDESRPFLYSHCCHVSQGTLRKDGRYGRGLKEKKHNRQECVSECCHSACEVHTKGNLGNISKRGEILSPATKPPCSTEGKQVDKAERGGEVTLSALKPQTCLQT